jgi:hypothetical protein
MINYLCIIDNRSTSIRMLPLSPVAADPAAEAGINKVRVPPPLNSRSQPTKLLLLL